MLNLIHGGCHHLFQAPQVGGASAVGWVVTPAEKAKCEEMFIKIDTDMDGLVNGVELREIFLQSGLGQPVLAHIWLVVFNTHMVSYV